MRAPAAMEPTLEEAARAGRTAPGRGRPQDESVTGGCPPCSSDGWTTWLACRGSVAAPKLAGGAARPRSALESSPGAVSAVSLGRTCAGAAGAVAAADAVGSCGSMRESAEREEAFGAGVNVGAWGDGRVRRVAVSGADAGVGRHAVLATLLALGLGRLARGDLPF
ncbi:unnamed protein product [Pedinophyceae sp. YPF-701]|nr:unnamed protein product [Pedinophyceae sp. YPF-701]